MTDAEFRACAAVWQACWPSATSPGADGPVARVWRRLWEGLSGGECLAAIEAIARRGDAYPPPPGAVVAMALELREDPALWAEVWAEIMAAARDKGERNEYLEVRDPLRMSWSRPEIGRLCALVGWSEICATTDDRRQTLEAQCREKWRAMERQKREDHNLAAVRGSAPRLDAARERSATPLALPAEKR